MKEFLLFGLGNPGGDFSHTRHNLGIDMLIKWIEYMRAQGATVSNWKTHEKFHARVCEIVFNETTVVILDPIIFMNELGKVLHGYLRYHPLEREHMLVVYDDLELALGEIKFQASGSAHGHNGMRSVHEYMGDTNVPQLRIGIGRPADVTPIDKFVLSTFTPDEKRILEEKEVGIMKKITERVIPASEPGSRQ
ncbi:MAG: aminoacyl-tRNA hydrolase [Patescibacteria group bacterium]